MKKIVVAVACVLVLAGCTDPDFVREIPVFGMDAEFLPAPPLPGELVARPSFDTPQARLGAMQLVADDGISELWYCNMFLEIAVVDKSSGHAWFSTPYNLEADTQASGEIRDALHSLLRIVFLDAAQNERRMTTFSDAVPYRQFGHRPIDGGIEIQVIIGRVAEQMLVPHAAHADTFEELVLDRIDNARDRNRLLAFYTRFSWDDDMPQATRDNLLEFYPGIVYHDFYILRSVTDREMRMLEEIIAGTDYTWEQLFLDAELSGHEAFDESPPVFKFTMSFVLDGGVLVATLPAQAIEFDDEVYFLMSIRLLEYFGAGQSARDGYIFVPDGSGALIYFNSDNTKPVAMNILPIFGEDVASETLWQHNNIRGQARFPVFGLREEDRAWFAIASDGAAMADIVALSGGFFSGYESVSPILHFGRSQLVVYSDALGAVGSFRHFDRNTFSGTWTFRYSFLVGDDANYSGMARTYRDYLLSRGHITPLQESTPAVFLEVLGLYRKPDSRMGLPYNRRISLTTFEQAESIMQNLAAGGITNLNLRYRGWFNGGLDHRVPNRLSVERTLGGTRGLRQLTQTAAALGFAAYFETDFTFVRQTGLFCGYNRLFHGPRAMNNTHVYGQPAEMLSNAATFTWWNYNTISPNSAGRFFLAFAENASGLNIDGLGISISSAGTTLMADYNRSRPINLQQGLEILTDNLDGLVQQLGRVVIDGPNAYALPFAEAIMNIPLACSAHLNTDASVPFMQMVLHGFVPFSGPPINMAFDTELALLRSIEFGAAPAFVVAYENAAELKGSAYSFLFSIDYNAWRDYMSEVYHAFIGAFDGLANVPMHSHEVVDNVAITTFQNGVRIFVNYNEHEASVDGVAIAPRSFEVR